MMLTSSPRLDLEIDVAQRPEFLELVARGQRPSTQQVGALAEHGARAGRQGLAQQAIAFDLVTDDELLAEILGADHRVGHAQIRSAKPRSMRRKVAMPIHRKAAVTTRLSTKPGK